jgi:mannose-6-phosphate isomerase-like protein (cupin superfamily)
MTNTNTDAEQAPVLRRIDSYEEWRQREGANLVGGIYVRNMKEVPVSPWPRKGVNGALIYLDGDDEMDQHLVEIPPGKATTPQRHLYTEVFYILSGTGSTTVWQDDGAKQTFEWGPNSFFALPTNTSYQFFNASLSQPARYFSVTDMPTVMRRWASEEFIFNNPFNFRDRFSGEPDYFSAEAKLYRGRVWETNFIPDIKKLPLYERKSRGGAGSNAFMIMGSGMTESHISRMPPGYYKKGHRHGPDAHLYITEGEGYVLMQRGDEPRIRCDWSEGSLYLSGAGQGLWLHQHFNVGRTPAAYLSIHQPMNNGLSRKYAGNRWMSNVSTVIIGGEINQKEGGRQIEYEDEDPEIHRIYEEELRKRGNTCNMKNMSPYCTGEAGMSAGKAQLGQGERIF